jgi:hypothetical protein
MTGLPKLQDAFQGFILTGSPAIRDKVVGTVKVDAATRLGIYANGYRLRLIEALDTDYPGLHTMAGDEEFDRIARAYIDAHPSTFRSLRWFGDRMDEFLRTNEPWFAYPVFAEMAAFEWATSTAFDAADSHTASVEDMATITADAWPDLTFTLHPSVQRLDLRWNVPTVWKAIDADDDDPPALAEHEHPLAWLLWRHELLTRFRSLRVDEAWALDALRRGDSFAALCEGLTEWIDGQNAAAHAAGLLKQWLTDGLICKIHLP